MRSANTGPGEPPERPQAARLRFLATLEEGLPASEAVSEALQQAVADLAALGGCVHVRDRAGGLRLVAAGGIPRKLTAAWARLSEDADAEPARIARDAGISWWAGDSAGIGARGVLGVPIPGAGRPAGVLSLFTVVSGPPRAEQAAFLWSVAGWIADRMEPSATAPPGAGGLFPEDGEAPPRHGGRPAAGPAPEERVPAGRTARMEELTAALSEAVTSKDVVDATAQRVLPPFGADGLIVQALDGKRLHVVGSAGYSEDFLQRYLDGIPLDSNSAVADVLRNRTPRFVGSRDEFLRLYPRLAETIGPSGKHAWALLPLIASGRDIGSCAISFTRPRSFPEEERTLLIAFGGLIAQALERARLYDGEHLRAQRLQRGLLPRSLPELPAVRAAARYLPAGKGGDVGGDWYDVIPLSADRVAMVIGDVMGHGIAEAATMGRLRTAVRTLADLELAPDEVLSHLNDLVADLGDDYFATCLYAVFDPVSQICSYASAGHPAPVVLGPDATVRRTDGLAVNPPLGAAEPPFDVHELRLPEGSLLVFCTDGLLESATRDFDEGLAQLTRTLTATAAQTPGQDGGEAAHLDRLCDAVVSALLPDHEATSDDAALLIARTRRTAPADIATWSLPEDPRAAGQAREHVQHQLSEWKLDDLVPTTELLVSELVGNAVRHGRGPIRLRLLRSRALICEVSDGSLTTPRIRRAAFTDEGGRGLQLVAALSRRWGTRYTGDGKCIWTEQESGPTG